MQIKMIPITLVINPRASSFSQLSTCQDYSYCAAGKALQKSCHKAEGSLGNVVKEQKANYSIRHTERYESQHQHTHPS